MSGSYDKNARREISPGSRVRGQAEFEAKKRRWESALSALPDDVFSKLSRVYLGFPGAPYNKARLLELLESFFNRAEIRANIAALLDEDDLKVLTMINAVNGCTVNSLIYFLKFSMPQVKVRAVLASLKERGVVYTYGNDALGLNPYLESALQAKLSETLFYETKGAAAPLPVKLRLTPSVIAAAVSYVVGRCDVFKTAGGAAPSLKKRAASDLERVFGEDYDEEFFTKLFTALQTLGIIAPSAGTLSVSWGRLASFASLSGASQACLICSAAVTPSPRGEKESAGSVPAALVSDGAGDFRRIFDFLREERGTFFAFHSVFEGVILRSPSRAIYRGASLPGGSSCDFESMIDTAAALGILDRTTRDESAFLALHGGAGGGPKPAGKRLVSVDTNLCVTVAGAMSLPDFIPLLKFTDIKKYDDAALTFELTRQSVFRAFNLGMKKDGILSVLEDLSDRAVPSAVRQLLDDWAYSYDTLTLYKGYILRVNDPGVFHAKARLAPFIKEELAPNVFLLTCATEEEVKSLIPDHDMAYSWETRGEESTGLFYEIEPDASAPAPDHAASAPAAAPARDARDSQDENRREAVLSEMRAYLAALSVPEETRSILEDRIRRRVIVDRGQLRPDAVKPEVLEAGGMDFAKKSYVFSVAIENHDAVELRTVGSKNVITGLPLNLTKGAQGSIVRLATADAPDAPLEIPVSSVMRVRILKKEHIFR